MARPRKAKKEDDSDDGGSNDFSVDPGTQVELELEDTCCVTASRPPTASAVFPTTKTAR